MQRTNRVMVSGLGLFILLSAAGCATAGKPSSASHALPLPAAAADAAPASVEEEESAVVAEGEARLSPDLGRIPTEMNEHVKKWITYFTKQDRERFGRFLARGAQYRQVVEDLLEENELPPELYYLAMIESGFTTHARSHAAAVGTWQFIPGTGRRYGLEINAYVDERIDPIRSTEAAARYLKDLYNVFGSWYLAMAAYNAGEYRIVGSVVRGKSRDFFELVKKGVLPRETADYVPKFLAAALIGTDPEKYGFEIPEGEKYPDLEAVELPAPVRLSDVASVSGVPLEELKRVNPHLRQGMTPPGAATYELWVPEKGATALTAAAPKLASLVVPLKNRRGARSVAVAGAETAGKKKRYVHVVRQGDGLIKIAREYKVSVAYLRKVNQLRSDHLVPGMKLRVAAKAYHPKSQIHYRVRRGDSLYGIARRFGVSVQKLKRDNGLEKGALAIGQTLRIGH